LGGGNSPLEFLFRDFFFRFFWGPLEKKSHQNIGSQSAPADQLSINSSKSQVLAASSQSEYILYGRKITNKYACFAKIKSFYTGQMCILNRSTPEKRLVRSLIVPRFLYCDVMFSKTTLERWDRKLLTYHGQDILTVHHVSSVCHNTRTKYLRCPWTLTLASECAA
jgi:hypothetical protein